jgi:hypothetical protein
MNLRTSLRSSRRTWQRNWQVRNELGNSVLKSFLKSTIRVIVTLRYVIIRLTPHWDFSVTDYVVGYHAYAHVPYLALTIYLYNNCDITFLTVFILTHPVNSPCGRKPERPDKTHDFRQSVDWIFSHESITRIEPTISEMKDTCSDHSATEAPKLSWLCKEFNILNVP